MLQVIKSVLESEEKGLRMNPICFLNALWTLQELSGTDWGADQATRTTNCLEKLRHEMCRFIKG